MYYHRFNSILATLAIEGNILLLLSSIMDIFHGAVKLASKTLVKYSCQEIDLFEL
jgi:hypothetical protein